MDKAKVAVAVYQTHEEAAAALKKLQDSGFETKAVSLICRHPTADREIVGYYSLGDRMKSWGKSGAIFGGLWGLLLGSAFFLIPGLGPVAMGGPFIGWLVSSLEASAVVGGLGVVGAALVRKGIPKESAAKYEAALKADKIVLLAHGTAAQVAKARTVLTGTGSSDVAAHG